MNFSPFIFPLTFLRKATMIIDIYGKAQKKRSTLRKLTERIAQRLESGLSGNEGR